MRPIKSLLVSMNAQFEQFVNQVENHEAVANSIISEVEAAAAKARVQYRKVNNDLAQLKRKLSDLAHQESLWKERARKIHAIDEYRALECVRRIKRVQQERAHIESQIPEVSQLERQLACDLTKIDQKLSGLKRTKDQLATRQSCAKALTLVDDNPSNAIGEIDDLFERWETKVTHWEIKGQTQRCFDDFGSEFEREEEEAALKGELETILNSDDIQA